MKVNVPVDASDEYRVALAYRNDKQAGKKPRKRMATRKEILSHLGLHCDIEMSELERDIEREQEAEREE